MHLIPNFQIPLTPTEWVRLLLNRNILRHFDNYVFSYRIVWAKLEPTHGTPTHKVKALAICLARKYSETAPLGNYLDLDSIRVDKFGGITLHESHDCLESVLPYLLEQNNILISRLCGKFLDFIKANVSETMQKQLKFYKNLDQLETF